MFSTKWETSKRQYDIIHERNVAIPVRAGFTLDCDILRPESAEKFPSILCLFPFYEEDQIKSIMPVAVCPELVSIEGGDCNFYVRRGYAQVFANVRDTGRSGGLFDHLGDRTIEDIYDVIEWLAKQPWCEGQVATFGTSYFAILDSHGLGHLWRETPAEITVYHNNRYPSHLFVPITKGNRIGTFIYVGRCPRIGCPLR